MGILGQLYIVPLLFLYGLFTQPCSFGCYRIERSISKCKHIRLKMWMRSLVQENPPTISNKFNVLEIIAMELERTQVHFISGSLVRQFRIKSL